MTKMSVHYNMDEVLEEFVTHWRIEKVSFYTGDTIMEETQQNLS